MKKQYRLKHNEDLKKIIKKKRNLVSSSFVAYFNPNNLGHTRIGISVSSKLGNAVIRNRIKRQVRMMVQEVIDLTKSVDFIFIVRKHYLKKSFLQNQQDLRDLTAKVMLELGKEV